MYGHSFCAWLQVAFPNQVENQKTIITGMTSISRPGYNVFNGDEIRLNESSFVFLLIGIVNNKMGHEYFYITDRRIYQWFEITYGYITSNVGQAALMGDDDGYLNIRFASPKLGSDYMEHLDAYTNQYTRSLFTSTFRNHSSYRKL